MLIFHCFLQHYPFLRCWCVSLLSNYLKPETPLACGLNDRPSVNRVEILTSVKINTPFCYSITVHLREASATNGAVIIICRMLRKVNRIKFVHCGIYQKLFFNKIINLNGKEAF